MKLFVRIFLMILAAGLGLAAGFTFRESRRSSASPAGVASSASLDARGKPSSSGVVSPGAALTDDSPLATQLESSLSKASGVTRWLYWLEALEKAVPSDFPRLARLAKNNPAALRLVAERWAELAPRHLFNMLVSASRDSRSLPVSELARTLFDVWPKTDPEAVITALNEAGDVGMLNHWRMWVADAILDKDVERGLRLRLEWHFENYGPRMDAINAWVAADPRHAAEFTLQNSAAYVGGMTMDAVGKEWGKKDPTTAMTFAAANASGLSSLLGRVVLEQWTERDLDGAAAWLAAADERSRNRFSPAFVQGWAQKDPGSALEWCQENLTGSSLVQAVGGALRGAASKDVAAAAALVTGMDPSPARTEGAATVAQRWFPGLSAGDPVKPEAITWLSNLDPDSLRRVLDDVHWGWASSDPKSMAAFLANEDPEKIPESTYSVLARLMAQQTPLETMNWANRLPGATGLSAGADGFAEWRSSQPDAATQWLNALPEGDARREPYFQKAIQNLAYHPQAAEELAAMNDADRAAARNVIAGMKLPDDRRTALLTALGTH